jgi:anti-sigma regulatory factor (Ser/Thr protein kinase)/serine/threonine protein phosphatase PrpC
VQQPTPHVIRVSHMSDVAVARQATTALAAAIGFVGKDCEEIALAVSELATNLVKHAHGGTLMLTALVEERRVGLQITSHDGGPGIADVGQALTDGFSTVGSLGYGLGTVNRMMDTMDITSQPGQGTRIVCRRWVRQAEHRTLPERLDCGAATRAHPLMGVNGDAFVLKQWSGGALVGVIDGLGHGQFAHRAAQTAWQYVESHFDQPLEALFRGVEHTCSATRGVVMALARFVYSPSSSVYRLTFASIGNIEAHLFDSPQPGRFLVRRGVLGLHAPMPAVTEHPWGARSLLVLHSDGVRTRWQWEDFRHLAEAPATVIARQLLRSLARGNDDATVVVVKNAAGTARQP